jgi:hypothetical protein
MLLIEGNSYAQDLLIGDSIKVAIAPAYNEVGKTHLLFFGNGYRSSWAAPVSFRICYLSKEKGGLRIVKKGGGLQTRSLRLKDSAGKEWVLRTIQKYPEQGLPPNLRYGLTKNILQDQVITAHPFASLTVATFAQALGIPHSNPELVYVPNDTALGQFRSEFANAVYLLEEREAAGDANVANTDNTDKVQQLVQKNHDETIDQRIVLRARMLDMVLGDWDRHEDQWRWEKEKKEEGTLYTPIPRDRDMVYYNTSGIFPWVVSHQWLKSRFQGFHNNIRDINGFNFNARYFDRYFLNEPDEATWREEISYVKKILSDSLISAAIHKLPDTIFSLTGPKLISTIMARRNNLERYAISYYHFISKTVEIPASDKREHFLLSSDKNGNVTVELNKLNKSGKDGSTIYRRIFVQAITKEIRLYGMDGNDIFTIDSNFNSIINIRMVGGADNDSFFIHPTVENKRNLFVYDKKNELNHLPGSALARYRLSNESSVNVYDKRTFRFDYFAPVVSATYGLDEGITLRTGLIYEKQGFRKSPYSFRHELMMNYSFVRKAFLFTYSGIVKKIIGNNDLNVNVYSRAPQNLSNFFGKGNESSFNNKGDQKITYYRSRYDYINATVQLIHPLSQHWHISGGVALQYYTSNGDNNTGRFLNSYDQQFPQEKVYENKYYAGFTSGIVFDTRNNIQFPTHGIYWNTSIKGMKQIGGDQVNYSQLLSEFNFYTRPFKSKKLVIANRTGLGFAGGDPAFFQLMYLGGPQTMRGFHTNRFAGKTAVYDNLEMRIKLFDFNSYLLPGTVGLIGFNDLGRVWMPGESSCKWHDSYGTGVYVQPAQLILIQFVVGFSKEGSLPYISIGFRF